MIRDAHKESVRNSRKNKKEANVEEENSHFTPGITKVALPSLNVRRDALSALNNWVQLRP